MRCIGNLIVTSREPKILDNLAKIKINNEETIARILLVHDKIIINTKDEKISEFIKNILMKEKEVMKTLLRYVDISIIVNNKEYPKEEVIKSIENIPLKFSYEEKGYRYKRKKHDDILVIKRNENEFEVTYFFNPELLLR